MFNDYPIKSMAIFGSYSRSEQNDSSDLDILVEFSDKIGIRWITLQFGWKNRFGITLKS
ncbi:MAG: nucleotidyltransferase family protein [Prolixibacteraceae bacterium]